MRRRALSIPLALVGLTVVLGAGTPAAGAADEGTLYVAETPTGRR